MKNQQESYDEMASEWKTIIESVFDDLDESTNNNKGLLKG